MLYQSIGGDQARHSKIHTKRTKRTVQVSHPSWRVMDVRPILNAARLVLIFLFILFVVFSRTSMLRDNPLSGILG